MKFDWSDLAFGSKKAVNDLRATFIPAPRELSPERFKQLVKTYLPQGNIVLGFAKEDYILGFEGQPQFMTLKMSSVQSIIDKVNKNSNKYRIYTLSYHQREWNFALEALKFKKVVLVRGSWQFSFHTRPEYYTLINRGIPYDTVSPFASEQEARDFAEQNTPAPPQVKGRLTEQEMLKLAREAAGQSCDYSFQTGVALGRKKAGKYEPITTTFNKVVPFQTYAMHYGVSREINFSVPHDLNHYDTVHAEVELIVTAQKKKIGLTGTALFINLLPCPSCARMLAETDIGEFVYTEDHSKGYAIKMLELAGKKVRRAV